HEADVSPPNELEDLDRFVLSSDKRRELRWQVIRAAGETPDDYLTLVIRQARACRRLRARRGAPGGGCAQDRRAAEEDKRAHDGAAGCRCRSWSLMVLSTGDELGRVRQRGARRPLDLAGRSARGSGPKHVESAPTGWAC